MEYTTTLLTILFGWLLGLLSPTIINAIQSEREIKKLKKTLFTELEELRYKLALVVYRIESKHGKLDKAFIQWAQGVLAGYDGINKNSSFSEGLSKISNFTDEQISQFIEISKKSENGLGLELKKQTFSLQNSDLVMISKFEVVLQNHLLDIKARIGFLNEIVDDSKYYFRLSFQQDISDRNYKIADTNMVNSYKSFSTQARIIVDLISKIISEK